MLHDVFENRDKRLANVIKIGHFLARSLRENVELFKYDSDLNKAVYLTESKKLISGIIVNGNKLTKLEVEDANDYFNQNKFNKRVNENITSWLGNLYEDKYLDAEGSFGNVLSLWSERSKLTKLNSQLEKKSANLAENKDILKTPQFKKLVESLPALVEFLKKNKEKVSKIAEVKNGVVLSNTIANAFGLPKISYETLAKNKKYEISESENTETLFNLITRQELIRKELIESKKDFEGIWSTNEKVLALAESITQDDAVVHEALAAVIIDIPYFALLSKKQLTEMFDSLLNEGEELVSIKNIQRFSSYVFECKKEIKNEIINILSEQYGINTQNLKDPVTYRSLLNTQIIIFESLRRLLPKDSVYRPVLKDVTELLKEKNGVEAIDVNDLLHEMFTKSEYGFLTESVMTRYLNFAEIANDLGSVANVLKMIQGSAGGMQSPMGAAGGGMGMPPQGMGMQTPQVGAQPNAQTPMDGSQEDLNGGGQDGMEGMGGMGGMPGQEDMMGGEGFGEEEPPMEMGGDQLMASLAELEALIDGIKVKLGEDPGMEGGMEGEMPMDGEGMEGMEGEEGMEPDGDEDGEGDINIDTGEGDDEIHVDKVKGSHDMEDADDDSDDSEEAPPKKKESKGKPEKKESKGKPSFKKGKE